MRSSKYKVSLSVWLRVEYVLSFIVRSSMKIKSIVRRFDANSADKKKQEVERRYLAVFSISDHSCFSILMLEKKITSTRCAPIFLDSLSLRRIVRRTVDRLDRKVVGIDIEIGTNGVEVLKKKTGFRKYARREEGMFCVEDYATKQNRGRSTGITTTPRFTRSVQIVFMVFDPVRKKRVSRVNRKTRKERSEIRKIS